MVKKGKKEKLLPGRKEFILNYVYLNKDVDTSGLFNNSKLQA